MTRLLPIKAKNQLSIGIFGDSYADNLDVSVKGKTTISSNAWTTLLESEHNLNVKNYAVAATSLFYSFLQFNKNKDKHDTIIFVLTNISRIYHSDVDLKLTSIKLCEEFLNKLPESDPRYMYFKAGEMYYKYLYEQEFHFYVHQKIIRDIIHTCETENKRLILIPGFPDSVKKSKIFKMSLSEITSKELIKQFGNDDFKKERPKRSCHLSKRNNQILAQLIVDILNDKINTVDINNFEFIKVDDPETYWEL